MTTCWRCKRKLLIGGPAGTCRECAQALGESYRHMLVRLGVISA